MNDSPKLTNDRSSLEHPRNGNERRCGTSIVLAGEDSDVSGGRRPFWNSLVVRIILLFWAAVYCGVTVHQAAQVPGWVRTYFWPRLISSVVGALLSLAIARAQERQRENNLSARAVAAFVLALMAAAAAAALAFVIERPWGVQPFSWTNFVLEFYPRIFTYGSISGIVLAVSYAGDIRRREQRIAALQALADSAEVRALRNQLNPHFLFNALNSIASLIAAGRNSEAERMTESVADFLRMSIVMDPHKLISLGEELRLQDLYLTIETSRFPDRLVVENDIPDHLSGIRVPALITQPLIENSIKYAVARSTELVRLSIRARDLGHALELTIEDNGGNAETSVPKGARLGLLNVAKRLRAHYGGSAKFQASKTDIGGFRNIITIPHGKSTSNTGR